MQKLCCEYFCRGTPPFYQNKEERNRRVIELPSYLNCRKQ